ncbi:MAG: HD domain-containing protein [Lachnospiraceae bacterium]|nr:HD domain-containing protein [Lachnospiraceae bacterium]
MKMTAVMALKPGMVLAEDVLNFKNELLFPANTTLDDRAIAKLSRHSIMCVEVKEEEDFATTHFEKVRVSAGFRHFEKTYNIFLPKYKKMIDGLINDKTPIDVSMLFQIYAEITGCAKTGELLLDYLYNMLPSEDDLTYAHCLNSALIAGVFGTWTGMPREDLLRLIECGFFYDIGKLILPQELIWKPSKLTDMEFELMKTHTLQGYNLLKDQDLDESILLATLEHHEKCDGTGYPSKLKEDQINLFAKYIAIIDAYEAMTSARTYRQSLVPFQVIENFERNERFYPSIILRNILLHIANSQVGLTVRLSDERLAEVILINQRNLSRPLVKCGDEVIDLVKFPDVKIVAVL